METKDEEIQEEPHVHDTSTPNLFKMKRIRTKFWKHIMLIAPSNEEIIWESKDAVGAWCLKCKVKIQYKGKDVNGVKRHVEKHHPILLEQDGSGKKRRKTSTIQDCFASVQKRDLKPSLKADQRMGEALLVKWTSKSLRPFNIVEDEGFLQFAHWLYNLRTHYIVVN